MDALSSFYSYRPKFTAVNDLRLIIAFTTRIILEK
jgi:hypothetical protein